MEIESYNFHTQKKNEENCNLWDMRKAKKNWVMGTRHSTAQGKA